MNVGNRQIGFSLYCYYNFSRCKDTIFFNKILSFLLNFVKCAKIDTINMLFFEIYRCYHLATAKIQHFSIKNYFLC